MQQSGICLVDWQNFQVRKFSSNYLFHYLYYLPDAKLLMPKEVVSAAGKSTNISAVAVYALLCSDNDLQSYKLVAFLLSYILLAN